MSSVHEPWDDLRSRLRLGQRLTGTVAQVPRPGAIGVFVDLGLSIGGFVDVLLLPFDEARWPVEGTVTEFEVWWMDERPQIRLKPVDPEYVRDDFDRWILTQNSAAAERWRRSASATTDNSNEL
jgi:hypothetical protein